MRFREAIGALHDVVIDDLRQPPKDRSAHDAYLAERRAHEAAIRLNAQSLALKTAPKIPELSKDEFARLDRDFRRKRRQYWSARNQYANHLRTHDPDLWRLLMPYDPVITVAADVLFFECFSADESSYGCLTVDRGAFSNQKDVRVGTTNVDYSWELYEHFQLLRSYRQTRFLIDPAGFEVATTGDDATHREEKIELPNSWLRGFSSFKAR